MSDNSPQEKIIKLVSSDGKEFEVPINVIRHADTIKRLVEELRLNDENEQNDPIPLQNVSGEIFEKVIQYCQYHCNDPVLTDDDLLDTNRDISTWDVDFLRVNNASIFNLIWAAHELGIRGLAKVGCGYVANKIKGKSPEEIRRIFNIVNDFTPEEEEQNRRENAWASDLE